MPNETTSELSYADTLWKTTDAILAVERDNPSLKSKRPSDSARCSTKPTKMKRLIDLIRNIRFTRARDKARVSLGRAYEYFPGKVAAAEGMLGGEFYTPRSVVGVLVEMLEPHVGRIYDPACGSGGTFVQSEKCVEAHCSNCTDVSVFGKKSSSTKRRQAHMKLAIGGIGANLGLAPTFIHMPPELDADFVLANSLSMISNGIPATRTCGAPFRGECTFRLDAGLHLQLVAEPLRQHFSGRRQLEP